MLGMAIATGANLLFSWLSRRDYDKKIVKNRRYNDERIQGYRDKLQRDRGDIDNYLNGLSHTDYQKMLSDFQGAYTESPADKYARETAVNSVFNKERGTGAVGSTAGEQELANTGAIAASQNQNAYVNQRINLYNQDQGHRYGILHDNFTADANILGNMESGLIGGVNQQNQNEAQFYRDSKDNVFSYTANRYLQSYLNDHLGVGDGALPTTYGKKLGA